MIILGEVSQAGNMPRDATQHVGSKQYSELVASHTGTNQARRYRSTLAVTSRKGRRDSAGLGDSCF